MELNSIDLQQQFQKALQLHQAGELDKAQAIYLQILKADPHATAAMAMLGTLASQLHQYEVAQQWFQQALQLQPDAVLHNNLANVLRKLTKDAAAIAHYQQALQLNPNYAEAHNNLAGLLYKQHKVDEALKHYVAAVQLQPDYIDAHYNLGLLLLAQQRFDDAIKQFANVLTLYPASLTARFHLASSLLQQGRTQEAVEHFQKILKMEPEHVEALNNLGVAFLRNQQPVAAMTQFAKVLGLDEHHHSARSNLAATFLAQDRFTESLWHYQKVLEKHPDDSEANYNAGVAAMGLGLLPEAIKYFEHVQRLKPKHVAALTNLAAVYLKLNKMDKAISYYQSAAQLEPDNAEITYMLNALTQQAKPIAAPTSYLKNLFNNYAAHFDKHVQQTLQYQVPQALRQALNAISQQQNLKVLDLGCGTGLSGQAFKDIASYLVGVDLSEKMLAIAQQKNIYDKLICVDMLEYVAQEQQRYDLVIAADVLVYYGDLKSIFKAIYQVLSEGGRLLFSVEDNQLDDAFTLQVSARYAHAQSYIMGLAKALGYQVEDNQATITRLQDNQPLQGRIFSLHK